MKTSEIFLTIAMVMACSVFAGDKGLPIFGDSFDIVGTFAENWVSKNCTSADGVVKISHGTGMNMRGATPLEFVAEADVTVTVANGFEKKGQTWGGFYIEGYFFCAQPNGLGFCVWKMPEDKHSSGKYAKIPGFEPGKSVHLRLIRKKVSGGVKYSFYVNNEPAGEFIAPMPKAKDGANGPEYSPLRIGSWYTDTVVDNFLLSTVKHEDDSPNMVFNSGFEHAEDGIPTYYGLFGGFNYAERPAEEYETRYLKRFAQDANEKHSGNYSLRVAVNNASSGISIAPWQTGTVKGQAGVFSVWMKASTNGLPVEISFSPKHPDGRKIVNVTTEWQRYEVTRNELAGKGTYTPVHINPVKCREQDAFLWVDDLQAEIVELPEDGFIPTNTYATVYKPSELDRDRFGDKTSEVEAEPTALIAKKLPKDVKPSVDLDSWKDFAFEITDFWMNAQPARIPTVAYIACDDDNLYLGFRHYRERPESLTRKTSPHDTMIYMHDGLELFFKPNPDKGIYHFMATANGDRFDCYANDIKWNGNWTVTGKANEKEGSVDLLVTIPFADFVQNGFSGRWRVNLCRNEWSQKGAEVNASTAKHKKINYSLDNYWNYLELPADVSAKWVERSRNENVKSKKCGDDVILGRLDYYMNEEFAQWRVTGADGKTVVAKKPLADIPMGTNIVKFTANGKEYSDTVVKLPFRKEATQINKWARCVVKDGKNVIFTGPGFGVTGFLGWKPECKNFDTMMQVMTNAGFHQAMGLILPRGPHMPEAKALLEAIKKYNILYANWCDYGRQLWEGFPADKKKDPRVTVKPTELVELIRPYEEYLLTNLVIDEPELYSTSDETRSWLEYMKAFYPYIPVQMNNTVMGIPSKFADLKTDILMLAI